MSTAQKRLAARGKKKSEIVYGATEAWRNANVAQRMELALEMNRAGFGLRQIVIDWNGDPRTFMQYDTLHICAASVVDCPDRAEFCPYACNCLDKAADIWWRGSRRAQHMRPDMSPF